MKPELTKELKERFFAQYWGQKVLHMQDDADMDYLFHINRGTFQTNITNKYLLLRPLSSITDEEALKVANLFDLDESQIADTDLLLWIEAFYAEPAGYYVDGYTGNQLLSTSDYLRSVGFVLPFTGHSVEELISAGWVKLTTETKES